MAQVVAKSLLLPSVQRVNITLYIYLVFSLFLFHFSPFASFSFFHYLFGRVRIIGEDTGICSSVSIRSDIKNR